MGPVHTSSSLTARFARQHLELGRLAKLLLAELDTRTLAVDASHARRSLATFSGQLRVHAAMEQEALYPRLLASSEASVVAKAQSLLADVGTVYEAFFDYLKAYPDAASIEADPAEFSRRTMQTLYRLRVRMKREDDELYPLVEQVSSAGGGL
jgi:hypothetical protein